MLVVKRPDPYGTRRSLGEEKLHEDHLHKAEERRASHTQAAKDATAAKDAAAGLRAEPYPAAASGDEPPKKPSRRLSFATMR